MAIRRDFDSDDAPNRKVLSATEALAKIYRFCAYQERAHYEVKQKLYSFGLHQDEVDELMSRLVSEGFLNEERFARSFAGGKFRMKKWGKVKIENELQSRQLSKNCIRLGLQEIDPSDYRQTLEDILTRKNKELKDTDLFVRRDKLAKFAIGRGFEADLVWQVIRTFLP